MVLYCSECGSKLIKGSKFCTECGAKITLNDENYVYERGQSRLDKVRKKGNQIPIDEEIKLEGIKQKMRGILFEGEPCLATGKPLSVYSENNKK